MILDSYAYSTTSSMSALSVEQPAAYIYIMSSYVLVAETMYGKTSSLSATNTTMSITKEGGSGSASTY